METIRLKCNNCQGTLDVDPNREVISCPYCGEKTLVPESDEVKIAKIENDTTKFMVVTEHKNIKVRAVVVLAAVIVFGFIIISISNIEDSELAGFTFGMFVILIMVIGIPISDQVSEGISRKRKEKERQERERKKREYSDPVSVPIAYGEALDMNYSDIKELFEKVGFTNISLLKQSFDEKEHPEYNGSIEQISIAGDDEFEAGDIFHKDDLVIINYLCNV